MVEKCDRSPEEEENFYGQIDDNIDIASVLSNN